jgi:hypothetical protein
MMQQMMAYANANTTRNPPAVQKPPLTHFNIPTIGSFQPGGNAHRGRRPGRGGGGRAPAIIPSGHRTPRTPFANCTALRWGGREHCASLCTGGTGRHRGCMQCGPYVFQHRQTIQQHECVFLVWIRCGRWPHVQDVSPNVVMFQSSGSIRTEQCPTIHQRGVRHLHLDNAQVAAS